MAITTCPKCPSTTFEMKEGRVNGSKYRLFFIQCSRCGAAIGVQEFFNSGALLQKIAAKLGA
jgi:predicted nucleic-acid-binding Zn-ribbon protein